MKFDYVYPGHNGIQPGDSFVRLPHGPINLADPVELPIFGRFSFDNREVTAAISRDIKAKQNVDVPKLQILFHIEKSNQYLQVPACDTKNQLMVFKHERIDVAGYDYFTYSETVRRFYNNRVEDYTTLRAAYNRGQAFERLMYRGSEEAAEVSREEMEEVLLGWPQNRVDINLYTAVDPYVARSRAMQNGPTLGLAIRRLAKWELAEFSQYARRKKDEDDKGAFNK